LWNSKPYLYVVIYKISIMAFIIIFALGFLAGFLTNMWYTVKRNG